MYDGSAWVAISAKMDAVSAASGGTFTGAVNLGVSGTGVALKADVSGTLTTVIPSDGTAQALGTGDSPTFAGITADAGNLTNVSPTFPKSSTDIFAHGAAATVNYVLNAGSYVFFAGLPVDQRAELAYVVSSGGSLTIVETGTTGWISFANSSGTTLQITVHASSTYFPQTFGWKVRG
jgi:hypothetical protein